VGLALLAFRNDGDGDRGEDADDQDHDEELDQREAALLSQSVDGVEGFMRTYSACDKPCLCPGEISQAVGVFPREHRGMPVLGGARDGTLDHAVERADTTLAADSAPAEPSVG